MSRKRYIMKLVGREVLHIISMVILENNSHSGAPTFVCLEVLHDLCEVDIALDANTQKPFQIWDSNRVTYSVKHKIFYVIFFYHSFLS